MIYYHSKLNQNENISLKDFTKVLEFLDKEGAINTTFFNHHVIFEYYKDQLTFCDSYEAKQNTLTKFSIGKVTLYNIRKRFKDICTK